MQTISINFIVPQGGTNSPINSYAMFINCSLKNFTSDEVKTLCLLHWTGTKVIGKQNTDGYLLRKGKILFEVTPLTLAELLPNLDWLGTLPTSPIRPVKLKHRPASPPTSTRCHLSNTSSSITSTKAISKHRTIHCSTKSPRWYIPASRHRLPRRAHRHFLLGRIAQILARKPILRLLFWKPGNGRRKPACQFPIPNFPFPHRRCRERFKSVPSPKEMSQKRPKSSPSIPTAHLPNSTPRQESTNSSTPNSTRNDSPTQRNVERGCFRKLHRHQPLLLWPKASPSAASAVWRASRKPSRKCRTPLHLSACRT